LEVGGGGGNGGGEGETYPLDLLAGKEVPEGVDKSRKEDYLCEGDFERAFGMKRGEYGGLPKWKKQGLKKKVGLF